MTIRRHQDSRYRYTFLMNGDQLLTWSVSLEDAFDLISRYQQIRPKSTFEIVDTESGKVVEVKAA